MDFSYDYAERILREQFGVAELTGLGWTGTHNRRRPRDHSLPAETPRADDAHSVSAASS
jgi:hypothetical protein